MEEELRNYAQEIANDMNLSGNVEMLFDSTIYEGYLYYNRSQNKPIMTINPKNRRVKKIIRHELGHYRFIENYPKIGEKLQQLKIVGAGLLALGLTYEFISRIDKHIPSLFNSPLSYIPITILFLTFAGPLIIEEFFAGYYGWKYKGK